MALTSAELLERVAARRVLLHRSSSARRRLRARRLPPQRWPKGVELEYFTAIQNLLRRAKALVDLYLLPELPALVREAAETKDAREDRGPPRSKRGPRGVNELLDQAVDDFWKGTSAESLEAIADRIGRRISDTQRLELNRQIAAAVGVDLAELGAIEPRLGGRISDFTAENVALIKSIPERYFGEVEFRVIDGIRRGARHEEIAAELQQRFRISSKRAALIARDQVGKFYGELNAARQQEAGITHFVWRTVRDNRVREEHEELEGRLFKWTKPPADEGMPGEAINCRCFAEPYLEKLVEDLRPRGRRR